MISYMKPTCFLSLHIPSSPLELKLYISSKNLWILLQFRKWGNRSYHRLQLLRPFQGFFLFLVWGILVWHALHAVWDYPRAILMGVLPTVHACMPECMRCGISPGLS